MEIKKNISWFELVSLGSCDLHGVEVRRKVSEQGSSEDVDFDRQPRDKTVGGEQGT